MKILIVEDVELHAKMITLILEKFQRAEVIKTMDAFEAYAELVKNPDVDCIILDNTLPFVNGSVFLQKVVSEKRFKQIPVIVSSGSKDVDFVAMGAAGTLEKPYYPNALLEMLESCAVKK